jgi:hypothetical protein
MLDLFPFGLGKRDFDDVARFAIGALENGPSAVPSLTQLEILNPIVAVLPVSVKVLVAAAESTQVPLAAVLTR